MGAGQSLEEGGTPALPLTSYDPRPVTPLLRVSIFLLASKGC